MTKQGHVKARGPFCFVLERKTSSRDGRGRDADTRELCNRRFQDPEEAEGKWAKVRRENRNQGL